VSFRLLRNRAWMMFVDGENFAKSAQRALSLANIAPTAGLAWRRDVFLWSPDHGPRWAAIEPVEPGDRPDWSPVAFSTRPAAELRRAYYYTSDTADEPEWTQTRLAIRELGFEPRLFKRRQGRSKAVDVALASDVLTFGAAGHYEAAIIVAGDADYVPLVEAVKRLGLHVGVAFVTQGLSDELQIAADEYVDLTQPLCQAWQTYINERTQRGDRPGPG
jgi:NYN domain